MYFGLRAFTTCIPLYPSLQRQALKNRKRNLKDFFTRFDRLHIGTKEKEYDQQTASIWLRFASGEPAPISLARHQIYTNVVKLYETRCIIESFLELHKEKSRTLHPIKD